MKLIKGAKTWWRWWSTWLTGFSLAVFNLDVIEAALAAFIELSPHISELLSLEWQRILGTAILIASFLVRFVRQRRAHEIAEGKSEPKKTT